MRSTPIIGVLEAAIYVADLDATEHFYGKVLGLERELRLDGRHVFFRCGGTILLCFIAEKTQVAALGAPLPVPTHGTIGEGHVCFTVLGQDIDPLCAKLVAEDIEIEADFHWPNGARSVYVRDPDGNSIEFAEPKLWGIAV